MLALAGGVWITVAPIVHGQLAQAPSRLLDMFGALSYHYGTGALVTALAAFALGRATAGAPAGRRARTTVHAEQADGA